MTHYALKIALVDDIHLQFERSDIEVDQGVSGLNGAQPFFKCPHFAEKISQVSQQFLGFYFAEQIIMIGFPDCGNQRLNGVSVLGESAENIL